jgi:hypothetical protein
VEVRRHGQGAALGVGGALNEGGGFVAGCYRGRIGAFLTRRGRGESGGLLMMRIGTTKLPN